MSFTMFKSYAADVSLAMAKELAIANGVSPTQVELWTKRV